MKKTVRALLILSLLAADLVSAQSIRLMTYNIRYDNPDDGDDGWSERSSGLISLVSKSDPDVLGMQEVLAEQLADIEKKLKGYVRLGVGRDDGAEEGEFAPLFIRMKRFKVIDNGHFWLSEQPESPGKGWDAACIRICTWALVKDNISKKESLVLNTHLDHAGKLAREKSVRQLLSFINEKLSERVEQLEEGAEASISIILMGDFNFTPTDPNYPVLVGSGTADREGLSDAFTTAQTPPTGPSGTFNGFDIEKTPTDRIDYVWTSGFQIRTCRHIETRLANQRWPSDHLPVLVEVEIAD